jgi:zinc and cadmium transporter
MSKKNATYLTPSAASVYNLIMTHTSLIWILITCTSIGAVTVAAAALATTALRTVWLERMVSLSIGLMLATSFLHSIPEALESSTNKQELFYTLLVSVFGFFLLQKLALLRHNHHHEHDGHGHSHGHDAHMAGSGGWLIVLGGGFHNFTDGVVIAAAFMTDLRLGLITALSIAAHEVPHKLSDFVILLNAGFSRSRAVALDLLSSLTMLAGGVLGWWFLEGAQEIVPYMLMVAAGSFIYIAMSDLIPYVQHESRVRDVIPQISLMAAAVCIVMMLNRLAHTG